MDDLQGRLLLRIEESLPELVSIRNEMYRNPEIGGTEKHSSKLLMDALKEHGFSVIANYEKIQYAFKATYSSKKIGPIIGLFAEYDALPDIGHGCGHNLICTTTLGAAIGLRSILDEIGGKIIVFGTPGEENICTKTLLSPQGAFDEADVALMVHPSPVTYSSGKTLAIESLQIEFFGKSSHAGVSPEKGINALDAAVQCYQMIHFQKQYHHKTNVYGIINEGGEKASIIPDYASLKFLSRAWSMSELVALKEMIKKSAEAAATLTGCTYKIFNNESTNNAMMTNDHISNVFNQYLTEFGEKEIRYEDVSGSTDMGDVSHRMPAIHPWVGLDCPDAPLHSKEFADMCVSPSADKYLERCSKALACTAMKIITDHNLFSSIKQEFSVKETSNDTK